jgi:hypothetical protein
MLYIYSLSSEPGKQEAVIKFDGEASASTACLLNNALVDGNHITVKTLVDETSKPATPDSSSSKGARPTSNASALFASFVESSKNFANTVVDTAKQLDEKYQVTSTVSTAANTAWTATKDTAQSVDEKLKISETTNKLYDDVIGKVSPKPKASGSPAPSNGSAPAAAPEANPERKSTPPQ